MEREEEEKLGRGNSDVYIVYTVMNSKCSMTCRVVMRENIQIVVEYL